MKMIAEGIKTSLSTYNLAKKMGIEMPISTEVYNIIYRGKNPRQAVKDLMTRELKVELSSIFSTFGPRQREYSVRSIPIPPP